MITIYNTELTDVLHFIKKYFAVDYEEIEDNIFMFPLLTYSVEIFQDYFDVMVEIKPSHSTMFLGDMKQMQNNLVKAFAQILCPFLNKKVEFVIDTTKYTYTQDEEFRWISKDNLTHEDNNCNMIKEFNYGFDYSKLPQRQNYEESVNIIVTEKGNMIYPKFQDEESLSKN